MIRRIILTAYILTVSLIFGIDRPFKALAVGWDMAKKWKSE